MGFTWGGGVGNKVLNRPVDQNKDFFLIFKDDPNVKRFPWAKFWSKWTSFPSERRGKMMVINNQQQRGLK